ncbi:MAG: hypothetical protein WC718_14455 [Phycisphaerales bacterium]|jgi:hypothetical protein
MADVTVVAASIRPLGGCIIRRFTAGEAMTPGQPVYLSANDTVSLTDASAVATNFCIGVVVAGASGGATIASGEECDVVLFGPVTGYSTNMVVNKPYYTDNDAGVIADAAGDKDTIIGWGLNGSTMLVHPQVIDLS